MSFSKNELNMLSGLNIFSNFNYFDLEHILNCTGAYYKTYEKNEIICLDNEKLKFLGIIISGSVYVEKNNLNGDNTKIIELFKGDLLGENYAIEKNSKSNYTYITSSKSKLLCISFRENLSSTNCKKECTCRRKFTENLLIQIYQNNLKITKKLDILSKKSIRDKILAFLEYEGEVSNSESINLNLTKSKLAEYLCVNRSSLVRELYNMKEEGIIDFDKNNFTILK